MIGDWDWTFVLGVGLLLLLLYKYTLGRKFDHWQERGVPFIPPWPFFGNTFVNTLGLKTQMEFHASIYRRFKGHRFGGLYLMRRPVLYLMEPELVESVLVKDFSHFANRGLRPVPNDPFTLHLVNLRDEQWRRLRHTLTPVFSSGKLRVMTETMENCVDCLIQGLSAPLKDGPETEAELRESMARLTTDVIGATALGMDTRALSDPDSEFRRMGRRLFRPTLLSKIRTTLRVAYPGILSALRWKSLPKDVEEFFRNVIGQAIEERKERPRKDVLQLMIDLLQRGPPQPGDTDQLKFDENYLLANAFVFFAAGFETTAGTLSLCLFELAHNPGIQDKLRAELREVLGEKLTYEALTKAPYLDNTILETLRKYPPATALIRECTADYVVPGTRLLLRKGDKVQIPVYCLQHDPEFFPDPEAFSPERFQTAPRKATFLPFGDGPRICIGARFAKLEMKVALAKILLNFELIPSEKATLPVKFSNKSLLLAPEHGLWVKLKPLL